MKRLVFVLAIFAIYVALMFGSHVSAFIKTPPAASQEQGGKKPPDILTLGTDAKLGQVTFNHTKHITENRSIDGTKPIDCIECHHTAQPASEVAKHPPLKTAWPADRTTTLTAATVKDMKDADVLACRSCHARQGQVPKTMPAIPEIKHESSAAMITLTNQQAFHRNCASCHDEVVKHKPTAKAPKTTQCTMCHKKAA